LKQYTEFLRDKDQPPCEPLNDRDSLVGAMKFDLQTGTDTVTAALR